MDAKICKKCGKNKTLDNFYWNTKNKNYRSECKKCKIEYQKKFNHSPEGLEYQRIRYKYDKTKISQRQKLRYAVRAGKIQRQACEYCGRFPADAHHSDYSLPFSVQWFCSVHHGELHRRLNAQKI